MDMPFTACFRPVSLFTAIMLGSAIPQTAPAQSLNSVVIWPIDPVIESNERAAAFWMENPGKRPLLMQVRIFGWNQDDGEDHFTDQKEVTGTPPVIRIDPAQRQLIRLTRLVPVAPGKEKAYRVIIDEIPQASTQPSGEMQPGQTGASIQFRMRYSVPLYVYGDGLGRKPTKARAAAQPRLEWRTVHSGGKTMLEIRNLGAVHGKLAGASAKRPDGSILKLDMITGHVLPGAVMRWTIASSLPDASMIEATTNGGPPAQLARWSQ